MANKKDNTRKLSLKNKILVLISILVECKNSFKDLKNEQRSIHEIYSVVQNDIGKLRYHSSTQIEIFLNLL